MRITHARKFAASFFKRRWELEDYPLDVWQQWPGYAASETAATVFVARICGWSAIVGAGPTAQDALADLRRQLEGYRTVAGGLPRPGTGTDSGSREASELALTAPAYDDHLISGVTDLEGRE
jgi:hypothetical protein